MLDFLIFNIPKMDLRAPSIALGLLKATTEHDGFKSRAYDLNIDLWRMMIKDGYGHWWSYSDWTLVDQKLLDENWHILEPYVRKCLEENVVPHNPKVVGMSVFSFLQYYALEKIALVLREYLPNARFMIGGPGISIRNKPVCEEWFAKLKESNAINDWMFGESDFIMSDYLAGKKRPGINNWEKDPRTTVMRLVKPDYSDMDFSKYPKKHLRFDIDGPGPNKWAYITGSRGCVRKCTFCDVQSFWPAFKTKSGKFIAEEMIDANRNYGIKKFKFTDSLLNGNLGILREKCETLKEHGYLKSNDERELEWHGQWICRNRKQISPEFHDLLADAGLGMVGIGIESGSEKVRYHMKKKFDNESLYYTLEQFERTNVLVVALMMIGYPTETEADFQETLLLLERLAKMKNVCDVNVNNPTRILPGSPLGDDPDHFGIQYTQLIEDKDFTANWWYGDNDYATRIERFYRFHHKMIEVGLKKSYADDSQDKYMKEYIEIKNDPAMVKIMKEVHEYGKEKIINIDNDIRDKKAEQSREVLGLGH